MVLIPWVPSTVAYLLPLLPTGMASIWVPESAPCASAMVKSYNDYYGLDEAWYGLSSVGSQEVKPRALLLPKLG